MTRASDAEREAAAAALREASVEGRLSLEELAERADAAHRAATREELEALRSDLPAPVAPRTDTGVERHTAILSSASLVGRRRIGARTSVLALLGRVEVDLRDAILAAPEVRLDVRSILGSVEMTVPEGVEVVVTGGGFLDSRDVRLAGPPPPPGAPIVRVHVTSVLGSFAVRDRRWRLGDALRRVAGGPRLPPPT